jgi:hypothetical protein
MKGKRNRPASSSPTYERVVWQETKTGRGTKITGKVVAPTRTPKAKKLLTPRSKKRRFDGGLSTMKQPDADEPPIADPTPINFPQVKKRGGKVFCCLVLQKQPVKPVSVTTRNALGVTSVSRHMYFRNFGSRTTTSQHAVSQVPV